MSRCGQNREKAVAMTAQPITRATPVNPPVTRQAAAPAAAPMGPTAKLRYSGVAPIQVKGPPNRTYLCGLRPRSRGDGGSPRRGCAHADRAFPARRLTAGLANSGTKRVKNCASAILRRRCTALRQAVRSVADSHSSTCAGRG